MPAAPEDPSEPPSGTHRLPVRGARLWSSIAVLSFLLFGLLAVNFTGFSISATARQDPALLLLAAFADTLVFAAFAMLSRRRGWFLGLAVFLVFYGVTFALTALETVYVPNVLPLSTAQGVLVDGIVVAGVFSAALVVLLGGGKDLPLAQRGPLVGSTRRWVLTAIASAVSYLLLFVLVGALLYDPLAHGLAPAALAAEQNSVASSRASLVLPVELLRGALWALLALPALSCLAIGWIRKGAVLGLLFAVPISESIALATTIAPGLVPAHLVEVLAENLLFGIVLAWIYRGAGAPSLASKRSLLVEVASSGRRRPTRGPDPPRERRSPGGMGRNSVGGTW
jgi:hypothetical protein